MTTLSANHKTSASFIFVTLVIEAMGFGIIMPVLPDVIRKFVTDETQFVGLRFKILDVLGKAHPEPHLAPAPAASLEC